MNIGESKKYRGYDISRPCEEDYVTEIAHDTLKDAKDFIDRLILSGVISSEDDQEKSPDG